MAACRRHALWYCLALLLAWVILLDWLPDLFPEPYNTFVWVFLGVCAAVIGVVGFWASLDELLGKVRKVRPMSLDVFVGRYPPEGNPGKASGGVRALSVLPDKRELVLRPVLAIGHGGALKRINVRFLNWPWRKWGAIPKVTRLEAVIPNWADMRQKAWPDTVGGRHLEIADGQDWAEAEPICFEITVSDVPTKGWSGRVSLRAHIDTRRVRARKRVKFRVREPAV